ncbi:zf-HC2 domain-containing protein [Candidatus Palauibacter sp.]|uniref:zf-HC2 domain-containing protein n=1 Tax=Candidatus Palauibacter sp. TaxID=3101350 RepID=UPI003B5CDA03
MQRDSHEVHLDDETLNRFADGELPERSFEAVRSHLRSCAACRKEVLFIRALSAAIRNLPTPKPPAELIDQLFPEKPPAVRVLPLPVRARRRARSLHRSRLRLPFAFILAAGAAVVAIALSSGRAMAGSSTLILDRSDTGALTLSYVTVSQLAAEPSLRARIRYWIPDPLRFTQTEPGFGTVDLERKDSGRFEGIANLPPGTVYAVAVVEDRAGDRIDSNRGAFWEYLEKDPQGRPTLSARLYQILAHADLNSPLRVAEVTEEALLEYPERPELWAAFLLFRQGATADSPGGIPLRTHPERLERLDSAARNGKPGPAVMHALGLYARLLGREDLEAYWQSQLISEHPRHEYASQVRLQGIVPSPMSYSGKLDALERSWRLTPMPSVAQVGLQLAYESAHPALTRVWLGRYAAERVLRDSRLDVEVTERMVERPALRTIAEEWVLRQLKEREDWLETDRPLDRTRSSFEAEEAESLARLLLLLGRLRLVREDWAAAFEAFESAAELSWNPRVFVELARFHAEAGSPTRASQLLALAQADPVIPPEPYLPPAEDWVTIPTEARLAAARSAWREQVSSSLLNEPVNGAARLESAPGEERTLREVTDGEVTLVIQSLRPSYLPTESLDLLRANAANLEAVGVRALPVAANSDPPSGTHTASDDRTDFIPPFRYDKRFEVWEALGAWRSVQYFVVGPDRMLRYRGEDLQSALRIALTLRRDPLVSLR